jgi:hypothetical protein
VEGNGELHETKEGGAKVPSYASVIIKFYMKDFSSTSLKFFYSFRYLDDRFVIWPQGPETGGTS